KKKYTNVRLVSTVSGAPLPLEPPCPDPDCKDPPPHVLVGFSSLFGGKDHRRETTATVIRTSWTNRNPDRRFYGCPTFSPACVNFLMWYDPLMCQRSVKIIPRLLRSRNGLEEILAMVEEKRRKEAQQVNELSYLTRQRQLLASVNYRRAIIEELKCFLGNLVSCKTTDHLKRIQKAVLVEEEGLDIDDSDLLLTPVIRPTNNTHIVPKINTTQTLFSSQNNQVDNCVVKPIRIIPGPAGIVKTTKLLKLVDTREGGEESVMFTQEYIRKVIEDVGEDDYFTHAPWLNAIDYVNVEGGIMMGCFGDVNIFLKNGKFEKIVAVIKSCTPNALGDPIVTLRDLYGIIFGTIHYKVLTEERFAKAFIVGSALILHNVFVFSPNVRTRKFR
nr:hypothetical protein [Tanacetum cinerariifolium]